MSTQPPNKNNDKPLIPEKYLSLQERPNIHPDDLQEEQITHDLTSNPFKQYSGTTRTTLNTPFKTPIEEFQHSSTLTGNPADPSSHQPRDAITSASIRASDIDSIPPTALFIGRIGQKKSPQLERIIQNTRGQREFFLKVGYSDEILKHTVVPTATFAALAAILSTPFERARTIAQADFASLSSLQDNGTNLAAKSSIAQEEAANHVLGITQGTQSTSTTTTITTKIPPTTSTATTTMETTKKTTKDNSKLELKKQTHISFSPYIQPERRDPLVQWFKAHPNSTRAPILKPNGYDIFVRRQVLLFEEEYMKLSTLPEFRMMSGYDRALAIKQQTGKRFENISVAPYSSFNHHIEHSGHAELTTQVDLVNASAKSKGNDMTSLLNRYYSRFGVTKPLEGDLIPQNQSDLYRGFHRFYNEPRFNSIRAVFRFLYQFHGFKGFFQLTSLIIFIRIIPILSLAAFFKPWKIWITQVSNFSSIFSSELQLGENHTRFALLSVFATYPLYTMFTRATVNKSMLYPQYNIHKDPELLSWKERFTQYHLQSNTLSKYSSKQSPDPLEISRPAGLPADAATKYPETGEHSPSMKKYHQQKLGLVNTMLQREERKSRSRAIFSQLFSQEGIRFVTRGWFPMLTTSIVYYTAFALTYAAVGTETIYKLHELRSDMRPAPPPGHQHDLNLETIKAVIPFSIATLVAQYAAYPFSTIRSYICAADSPGYITFNKKANALPLPIAVDQFRLPLRHTVPISFRKQLSVAFHEIRRQGGWRGFYRGSLIIPLIRLPQSIAIGACCFYTMNHYWPKSHEVIDIQHFYNFTPQLI